ncbi:MAG: TIGR03915 family putative DNA repair protein [Desulfopila sp.]
MTTPACIYLHDGSVEGLFTALAVAVKEGKPVKTVCGREDYRPGLFDALRVVTTDADQAERLFSYLRQLGGGVLELVIHAYLAGSGREGIHLYRLLRLSLDYRGRVTELHSDASVHHLTRLSRRLKAEVHRLCGLIRFRTLRGEVLYAPFQAEANVIGCLAAHFVFRLGEHAWILHDVDRDSALYWDGEELRRVVIDPAFVRQVRRTGEAPLAELAADELCYQQLWRVFHRTTANPDRRNLVLQRQFMPRRYWRYLVERQGESSRSGQASGGDRGLGPDHGG